MLKALAKSFSFSGFFDLSYYNYLLTALAEFAQIKKIERNEYRTS